VIVSHAAEPRWKGRSSQDGGAFLLAPLVRTGRPFLAVCPDGIGFGDTGDLLKRSPAEPFADFSEGGSLGIRKAYTGGKVSAEDAILSCEVFILEQEFLIDQSGDVRQQPSPFVVWHEEHPS
jgi:hypothetical protein